jgi:ribosomal protection tetracycline resistance protein
MVICKPSMALISHDRRITMRYFNHFRTRYEPINQFELTVPIKAIGKAIFQLSALRAAVGQPILQNDTFLLKGTLPVATTEDFKRALHSFTEGEGVFEQA